MAILVNPGTTTPVATIDVGGGTQSPQVNLINQAGASIYGIAGTPNGTSVMAVQGVAGGVAQPISGTVGLSAGSLAIGTTTALQGGTWTVQPGNTPNTSPWLVTVASGTTAAIGAVTQSGAWTVQPGNTQNTIPWLIQPVSTASINQAGTWTVQPGNTPNTSPWLVAPATGVPFSINVTQIGTTTVASTGLFTILRDAAGAARGANVNASNQLSVSVDGGALSASISSTATLNTNIVQVGSATVTTGSGVMAGGTQRVALATDGPVNLTTINGSTIAVGSGTMNSGTIRMALATDSPGAVALGQTVMASSVPVAIATNQSVIPINITQIGTTSAVTGGVAGSLGVGGSVATNVAIGTNPINLGAQGITSENSTVTAGRMVQLVADVVGKQIILPYANPENFVFGNAGTIGTGITGTAVTTLISAPGSGLRNYITELLVTNAHATVSTVVVIGDGTAATTMHVGYAAAAGGGFAPSLPVPLRQTTLNTAITCYCVTTGSAVYVSASGYKGV